MHYLGTADYLTSPMTGKVESWTHYNEWGEITHNAVLKCGQRELDLVKRYATHDYDSVLSMYYAKARLYDAQNRRFASIDPILDGSVYNITDYAKDPVQLIQYLYVKNNPVIYIDPDGLRPVIDDLDPYGAYSEKSFDYRYYRQEHKDMFIEGIVSSGTAPVHGFDLSQARDYQKKIKKCDNKNKTGKAEMLSLTEQLKLTGDTAKLVPVMAVGSGGDPNKTKATTTLVTTAAVAEKVVEAKGQQVVYTLREVGTNIVKYVGRTINPTAREAAHKLAEDKADLIFNIEKSGLVYEQVRGAEQMLFEKFGGFEKLLNKINPISPNNPRIDEYLKAAEELFK